MEKKNDLQSVDHSHHRQRLLQTVMDIGLENTNDFITLEFILTYVLPRKDTNPVAHRLFDRFGSIYAALEATPEDLMEVEGIGENSSKRLYLLLHIFARYNQDKAKNTKILQNKEAIVPYCRAFLANKPVEELYAICLNDKTVLATKLLARGKTNQVSIDPQEFMRKILNVSRVNNVVLTHSHPDNDCRPSKEDIVANAKFAKILESVNIKLTEHVIVCPAASYLMLENTICDN